MVGEELGFVIKKSFCDCIDRQEQNCLMTRSCGVILLTYSRYSHRGHGERETGFCDQERSRYDFINLLYSRQNHKGHGPWEKKGSSFSLTKISLR